MRWLKWILAYLFDCLHRHTTWPHRDRRGLDYICCLDCGKEFTVFDAKDEHRQQRRATGGSKPASLRGTERGRMPGGCTARKTSSLLAKPLRELVNAPKPLTPNYLR